jgi:uncharacterized membrane protein
MTPYSIVLFLHVVAMLGLFIALGTELLILSRVSRTVDTGEARVWIRSSAIWPAVALPSIALILLTGALLAARTRGWAMAWIQVSLGTMVLIGLLGGIAGRRMRTMRQIAANRGASLEAYQHLVADAALQIPLSMRFAAVLAIVLLMVARPDLRASLVIIGAAFVTGLLVSVPTWRRRSVQQTAS